MSHEAGRMAGKVAIVTGGASGIGAATSELFARNGAVVGIADLNGAAGRSLQSEIERAGGKAVFLEVNVADAESVDDAVSAMYDAYGRLDVFVNNAGIGSQSSGDEAGWWRLLRVNLLGVAWGLRAAIAVMRKSGGGSIVNTGSHAGLRSARAGVYGSSKAAVHTLTRYAALTHARDRVRVNAVLPGNIYTPIHDMRRHEAVIRRLAGDTSAFEVEPLEEGEDPRAAREALIEEFRAIHPLGRLATPDDIAQAALYLASEEAGVVTGNEFLVNGGIMAMMLRDRLVDSAPSVRASPVPVPVRQGTVAIVSDNPGVVPALAARCEASGFSAAISPHPRSTDETSVRAWLAGLAPLAGIVFAMRQDPGGDLFSQGAEEWEEELAADFRVPWVLAHAAAEQLPAGASVTFIADASGQTGAAGSPAYCGAAAALTYSTDNLADLLRPRGIRVNTLISEAIGVATDDMPLGAPSSTEDLADVALTIMRSSALTGLQLSLETSHPYDRPML
jgi:NAD(P)-dependent dehydrogenase (short-subunit alcohol dehydrogenase family)